MNKGLTVSAISAVLLALAATGSVVNMDTAVAQQASEEEKEELVVEAPIGVRQVGRSASTGARIEVIELKRRVNYADLDLSKEADVAELENRVETIAKESCDKLSDMFSSGWADTTEQRSCIKKAISSAEAALQAAIVAAR